MKAVSADLTYGFSFFVSLDSASWESLPTRVNLATSLANGWEVENA